MLQTNWESLERVEVYPGIHRRMFQGDNIQVVQYTYEPGSIFPVHHHQAEQVTVVEQGEIEFTVDGVPAVLRPGDLCRIAPDIPHGAANRGAVTVVTINLFWPVKKEFPRG